MKPYYQDPTREATCEVIAKRLSQGVLDFGEEVRQ